MRERSTATINYRLSPHRKQYTKSIEYGILGYHTSCAGLRGGRSPGLWGDGGADDKYECRDAFLAAKELAAGTG